MIKLIEAHHCTDFKISLTFSDGTEGVFDGKEFLKRNGPLLDALRNESYFKRAFIDAVTLNPERDSIIKTHLMGNHIQPLAA